MYKIKRYVAYVFVLLVKQAVRNHRVSSKKLFSVRHIMLIVMIRAMAVSRVKSVLTNEKCSTKMCLWYAKNQSLNNKKAQAQNEVFKGPWRLGTLLLIRMFQTSSFCYDDQSLFSHTNRFFKFNLSSKIARYLSFFSQFLIVMLVVKGVLLFSELKITKEIICFP